MFIRDALLSDSTAASELVNRAYRSDNNVSWTSEAGLVSGSRISPDQVIDLFRPDSKLLVLRKAEQVIGCVHIERAKRAAYIGMLACELALQNAGIGKQLLAEAEARAAALFQPDYFEMSVISKRPDLLAFYLRRGYELTGENEPYPVDANVGQPLTDDIQLHLLRKSAR